LRITQKQGGATEWVEFSTCRVVEGSSSRVSNGTATKYSPKRIDVAYLIIANDGNSIQVGACKQAPVDASLVEIALQLL